MIEQIKRKIREIKDEKVYTPEEIVKKSLIVNTKFSPSLFTVYRLIKNGKIKAVDLGTGGAPRYAVEGKELKKFLRSRFNIREYNKK